MKTFQIKTLLPGGEYGPTINIDADYFRVENGHLIVRREVRGSYPETLVVYAPGFWAEVNLIAGGA